MLFETEIANNIEKNIICLKY